MIYQPRDIGVLRYGLKFNNTNETFQIDPPIGIDEVPIKLMQGDLYERHIEYDETEIEFQPNRYNLGHQFDKLIEYFNTYSFESFVQLYTYINDELISIVEIDFETAKTNKETFFKTKIKNSDLRKVIEEKKDIAVDLFATKSLSGESDLIVPKTEDVILRAKRIREVSSFTTNNETDGYIKNVENTPGGSAISYFMYPFSNVKSDDIDKTEGYEADPNRDLVVTGESSGQVIASVRSGWMASMQNFKFNEQTVLSLSNLNLILTVNVPAASSSVSHILRLAVITYENSDYNNIIESHYENIATFNGKNIIFKGGEFNTTIPAYSRVLVELKSTVSFSNSGGGFISISNNSFIQFEGVSLYKDSNATMFRLIDSGKSILNNISDNQAIISAPRFEEDAEFWNLFTTSGFYLRGFEDETIDIKYSDWLKFIQNAFNCDVQITGNDVFIGKQEDFYQDIEVYRLPFQPDKGDDYEISKNERLKCNSFNIKYNKYEDEERDTLDAFHTESEWYIPSRIKNDKEIEINFIADGYSIEYTRREGIEAEPTTSKSKDNDMYIIDCYSVLYQEEINGELITRRQYYNVTNHPIFSSNSVDGIYSPTTSYNLRLSLKRLMIDHYSHYLAELGQSFNNGNPTDDTLIAKNTFYKANGNLSTFASEPDLTFSSERLKDNADVTFGMLKKPLITSDIYTFTLGIRLKYNEITSIIKDCLDKKGYITFYDENTEIKLFPKEIEYNQIEEKLNIIGEKKYD